MIQKEEEGHGPAPFVGNGASPTKKLMEQILVDDTVGM